jgi:hypothetical protein
VGLGTALRFIGVPDDVRDGFEALWRRCFEEAEVAPADFMRNCRDLRRDIENPGADLDAEIEDCKRAISTATEAEKAEHERKAGGNYNIQ